MRHGRAPEPPAGRHAAPATPVSPATHGADAPAPPAIGQHPRHAGADLGTGARADRRLRAVPDLPAAPEPGRRRPTPRLADILAAEPAPSAEHAAGPRPAVRPWLDAPDGAAAVPAPRVPGPHAAGGPAHPGDHPSLPGVAPVPRPTAPPARAARPAPPQPPAPADPTGVVTPPPATRATPRHAPATAATRTTAADSPATPNTPATSAKRPAARRSDPSEIAARATTTLISASPSGRRRADRAVIAPPAPPLASAQGPATPVFADGTGRRAKRWRTAAIAATAVCASYVGVVAVGAVAGPVGPTAAPTLLPPPTLAPPAPVSPTVDARNIAEVEPTTTARSTRATTTKRATPRSTTPRVPRTTPRPAVVAPVVPVAPQRQAPLVQQDDDEGQGNGNQLQTDGAAGNDAQAT
ncbi:hypothetical protein PHK61_25315 [Actinomycetospora lutea]|uniref:hypothetical protein n=1 Tax=Actinomycetospora lutea TaxID=663604 RepID=UPI00236503A2|nr:hypothetical protein [Actinomycetospora lutea]MDD7941742.1 hypothetical protein [Actinomycetospora lutea]